MIRWCDGNGPLFVEYPETQDIRLSFYAGFWWNAVWRAVFNSSCSKSNWEGGQISQHWHIAQINIATALYCGEDDRISEFYAQLDDINALADTSSGFVWRLQSESGNATDIQVGDDPLLIVNMSVWQTVEALFDFAYKSAHRVVMANRRQWFKRPDGAYQALWWVAEGHKPSVAEGMGKIALLQTYGPGPESFTFKSKFPCPGVSGGAEDMSPEPYCSGWK